MVESPKDTDGARNAETSIRGMNENG